MLSSEGIPFSFYLAFVAVVATTCELCYVAQLEEREHTQHTHTTATLDVGNETLLLLWFLITNRSKRTKAHFWGSRMFRRMQPMFVFVCDSISLYACLCLCLCMTQSTNPKYFFDHLLCGTLFTSEIKAAALCSALRKQELPNVDTKANIWLNPEKYLILIICFLHFKYSYSQHFICFAKRFMRNAETYSQNIKK